jgi:hypothetical protein
MGNDGCRCYGTKCRGPWWLVPISMKYDSYDFITTVCPGGTNYSRKPHQAATYIFYCAPSPARPTLSRSPSHLYPGLALFLASRDLPLAHARRCGGERPHRNIPAVAAPCGQRRFSLSLSLSSIHPLNLILVTPPISAFSPW